MTDDSRPVPPDFDPDLTEIPVDDGPSVVRVGNYRVLQRVGAGGMGEVYEAEQKSPVRRRVALKVIKRGMDTEQVVVRFESERQALALMDHACIARVYDSGATDDGRPYFAMEFVRGIPITDYCDRNRLPLTDRLGLFIEVCEGIQHAHQKGIIHRDIKPSNVLVAIQEDRPVPKIIDFGVAKATSRSLGERTIVTELGQIIGTPTYMSPEQAELSGLDVDTRSDVYSLGVLLYELVSGRLPFEAEELHRTGFDAYRKRILYEDPPRPSTRVQAGVDADLARARGIERGGLARRLRGDLDWITVRALEKDRTRRYGSASELAADVRRHLEVEPVLAGPPSALYRLGKFVRRNRAGTGFAAAILLLLAGFTVTLAILLGRVAEERDRANQEAERASQEREAAGRVAGFLVDLFQVSDPGEARGKSITALEILDEGARRIEHELRNQPVVQAQLMHTMGTVYSNLGLNEPAQQLLDGALTIRERELAPIAPETADTLIELAGLDAVRGDYANSRARYERALRIREALFGSESPEVATSLNNLANVLEFQGDFNRALGYHERALAIREATLGPQHPDVAASLNNIASMALSMGDYRRARPLLEQAIEIQQRSLGFDHPNLIVSLDNLGGALSAAGEHDRALEVSERAQRIRGRVLGPEHRDVATGQLALALLQLKRGEKATAARLHDRALVLLDDTSMGRDHPLVLYLSASYHALRGESDQAVELLRRASVDKGYASTERLLGDENLESLHDHAGFEAIVTAVRDRSAGF